ncbi:MAG: PhnD/SsuA/transferrin family substrate-binding protein [Alphaproteobacteria bacterium]|nr:PhnD/SsuA/transferrin family substrate-binding protein [Alphaproteobacteria bacterium]
MYRPAGHAAKTGALWTALRPYFAREGLADIPATLDPPEPIDRCWRAENLFLSQTCGYPLVIALGPSVSVVATPVYESAFCDGASYRNLILCADDADFRDVAGLAGRQMAYNETSSYSGYDAWRRVLRDAGAPTIEPTDNFSQTMATGAHAASMAAVAQGRADVCSVDCVTYDLLQRHDPEACAGLRIMVQGPLAPGLPLVTRGDRPAGEIAAMRRALSAFCADPVTEPVRRPFLWRDIETVDRAAYEAAVVGPRWDGEHE